MPERPDLEYFVPMVRAACIDRKVVGVGAAFSAAITGYMARGLRVLPAVEAAKAMVSDAIRAALPGRGSRVSPRVVEGLDPTPITVSLEKAR